MNSTLPCGVLVGGPPEIAESVVEVTGAAVAVVVATSSGETAVVVVAIETTLLLGESWLAAAHVTAPPTNETMTASRTQRGNRGGRIGPSVSSTTMRTASSLIAAILRISTGCILAQRITALVSRGHDTTLASLSDGADHSGVRCWRFPTRNSRNLLQAHLSNETTMTLVESDAITP
jgi:hypothetical protein